MHLLGFAALYASVVSFLALLFAYVDFLWPDPLSFYYAGILSQIRLSSSVLLVIFPVFIIVSWLIEKDFAQSPEKREIKFRKWLVYFTLFVAAITIIIDLVTLTFSFYSGDLTSRFFYKVLVVLIIALAVFKYYFWDLKRKTYSKENQLTADFDTAELSQHGSLISKIVAWVTSVVVVAVIVSGFFIVGTPAQQRVRRFDEQRVSDLQNIQSQVVSYWQNKGKLPKNIDDLKNSISGFNSPIDPETHLQYEYIEPGLNSDNPNIKSKFELCATFKTDSKNTIAFPSQTKPVSIFDSYNQNWEHGIGRTCFSRNIDTDFYPTRKPGI